MVLKRDSKHLDVETAAIFVVPMCFWLQVHHRWTVLLRCRWLHFQSNLLNTLDYETLLKVWLSH